MRRLFTCFWAILWMVACDAEAPAPPVDRTTLTERPAIQSYAATVDRAAPAVITVRSEKRVRAPRQFPFGDEPFFRDFFGGRSPRQNAPRMRRGLGSGVIVSQDGYCLTNHHVIDGAEEIRVETADGRAFDAKLVGSDPASDLAVLKIDAKKLPVLTLGNSDQVRIGDVVLALGNPLGVGQTVTMGIISAKGRSTGLGDGSYEDFLQTDAPINQGNSGGPLVNTAAELIGINSQILSTSGGSIGIGFAIPSNMARNVMDQLIKTGHVRRAQLGIGVQQVTPEIAKSLGIEPRGVLINSVAPRSAADKAGLRRGDVILALDGQPVSDTNAFRNKIAALAPGSEATLTIRREGREQQVRAKLGELAAPKDESEESENGAEPPERTGGQLGISVEPLTPEIARQLEVPAGTKGLAVAEVMPGGPASEAGIEAGDVIVEANGRPINSPEELKAALSSAGSKPVLLLIRRGDTTVYVPVEAKKK